MSILLWEQEASDYGANIARVQVWDAFSDMYLDTSWEDNQLERLANDIALSPFTFEELGHILFFEVTPICLPNLFVMPGGEWLGFSPSWLIPRCLKQQQKHPFRSNGNPDKVRFFVYSLVTGLTNDAYLLLFRAQRIRAAQ